MMAEEVLTPISQAMKEGVITRKQLKELMERSNFPGLVHLTLFLLVLCGTGTLVWICIGSWWVVPAMLLHGVVFGHLFALQHECCHYTAFKSRWINDLLGHVCGFLLVIPNKLFRYEHCDHHTYTNLTGRDPELIELPISLGKYLWYLSAVPYWYGYFNQLIRNSLNNFTEEERRFVPSVEIQPIVLEARIIIGLYLLVCVASWATGFWGVLWLWWLPMFLGEPAKRAIRMSEHVGRPKVTDLRENTRTTLVTKPMRFLCWNMNFHAEHHYASSVPFHALPRLHQMLHGYVYVEKRGYLGAHIDIITLIFKRQGRSDSMGSKTA